MGKIVQLIIALLLMLGGKTAYAQDGPIEASVNGIRSSTENTVFIEDKKAEEAASASAPVDLDHFDVSQKDCEVALKWQTNSESRFSHYELERSSDRRVYGQIKIIEARGDLNRVEQYAFTDQPTVSGDYFYRLKMVDLDGAFQYSKVAKVSVDCAGQMIAEVYPNPLNAFENLNLRLHTFQKEIEVAINNQYGQLVQQRTLKVEKGWNLLSLEVNELSPGLYYITLGGEQPEHIKFIRR